MEESAAEQSGAVTSDAQGFERNIGPAEIAYQTAKEFLSAGKYTEAIDNYQKAVSIKPGYLAAWSDLGKAYSDHKEYEKGIAAYQQALELEPGNEGLIAAIGYNYLNLEQWDEAAEYYEMLVAQDSLSFTGNVNLAFIAQRRGDDREAIQYYEKVLEVRPDDATTMGTLATLYGNMGNDEKKYEYLQMAIDADPDNHQFKRQLAKAYFTEREYAKAAPIYEQLVEIYPDNADLYKRYGFALSQTDRAPEAPVVLEKAIELGGDDDPFTWALLSKIYNENGMYTKAAEAARSGLALGSGEEAFLNYQWGEALSKLGRYEEAMARFQKVASMGDPTWSSSAVKQVDRQQKLIQRREAEKEQQMYE